MGKWIASFGFSWRRKLVSVDRQQQLEDREMQQQRTYDRIAQAIAYIQQNFQQQPQLDEVAAHIHLSPAHFQRLFSEWVGTSPKKFLQYISVEHAKQILG